MACLLLSCACSQQDLDKVGGKVADAYVAQHRDAVIRNFQRHLLDEPRCARFREAFWTEGRKHASKDSSGQWVLSDQPPPEGTPHEAIPLQRVR